MPRRSVAAAADTRLAVLRRAADIGSVEGLGGITIGRLATDLQMSKAGVVGQFGSKESLQLATIELAAGLFREAVWAPIAAMEPGLPRLLALCRSWVDYLADPPFEGGCFLALTGLEQAAQEGPVPDELATVLRRWHRTLAREVQQAVATGGLPADTDPEQVVFVLESLAGGVKGSRQIMRDPAARDRCLRAMHAALGVTD